MRFSENDPTSSSSFEWAVGIENTFVPQTRAGHRRLDEYELMDHYRLWKHDLDLAADLGITSIRYGIPWYRVNPKPGVFDWSWVDSVLDYLVNEKRLTPIVDLMHYGTPLWLDNQFVNAQYARRVAEYAQAFAERYRTLARVYTPLNEPSVTAKYCGRDGRWPPYLSGDDGYVKILMALAEGIAATVAAIRAVQPEALFIHVEDTGREWADRPELSEHAAHAQERRLLPLDLACGKVDSSHPWFGWLVDHGACEADLYHLIERLPRWDALGVNFYPWSNRRHSMRRNGRPTSTHDPAPSLLEVLRMIHRRYGLHVMITETSSPGSHADRAQWMAGTLSDVRQARGEGIPVVGYTWFPMFTMIEWKYRWSRRGLEQHLLHLGLWDVLSHNGQRDREATPLVETYRRFIANTDSTVGAFQSRHIDGPIGNSRVEMVA